MEDTPFHFKLLPPLALYVHVPWCVRKCPYCDFNSHALKGELPEAAYVEALLADLEQDLPRVWGRRVQSLFLGGGTPSLLSPDAIDRLLGGIRARVTLAPEAEITLEANPGTVEQARFAGYRAAGINRLSLGIQSFDDSRLDALGRIHDGNDARRAIDAARAAGFDNFNLDLMFGLPGQSPAAALHDVRTAIDFDPAHLSVYQLTLEPNTPFHARPPVLPDEDQVAAMQEGLSAALAERGYRQYEVSAYARDRRECRHNRNYWEFGDYLGIGAGAHAKLTDTTGITRIAKRRQPQDYLQNAGTAAVRAEERRLSRDDATFEFMLNALRLVDGVPAELFEQRTGLTLASVEPGLRRARGRGLLEDDAQWLRPTPQGRQFLNDLIQHFLPAENTRRHGQAD